LISPIILILLLSIKNLIVKKYKSYQSGSFLYDNFEKLEEKINKKIQKINSEIKKTKAEISTIPNIEDFKDMIEIKKKLLQNLKSKKDLIIQNEIFKYIDDLPVFVFLDKNKIYDINIVKKDKNLMEIYKLLIKNKFNKNRFYFVINYKWFEGGIDKINKSSYSKYFKNSINILNLTGKELEIELKYLEKYLNIVTLKEGE